jgi:hypothetical protein
MFKFVIKLRVVLRQPSIIDDINQQKFISLLPRIRDGKMNISDWEFLLSRSTSPSNLLLFNNSIRLFTDNM